MKAAGLLQGRKVIALGERDDIPAATVSACLIAAGGEIVYETTACYV